MLHAREDYNRIQDPANKIPGDEPVVLLRAQDKLAIWPLKLYALLCWVFQRPDVSALIRNHVRLMNAWPKKKLPDL